MTATAATNLGQVTTDYPALTDVIADQVSKITARLSTQISHLQNNTKDYKNTILGAHNQVHATQISVFSKTNLNAENNLVQPANYKT